MKHLVVVGFSQLVSGKYLECFQNAFNSGAINGYSVIETEGMRSVIEKRVEGLEFKPEKVYFIPYSDKIDELADAEIFSPIISEIRKHHPDLMMYIATEVRAHFGYLKYCVENEISSLTEKPVFAPTTNGIFDPDKIEGNMRYVVELSKKSKAKHSVMTMCRYHEVSNDSYFQVILNNVKSLQAPITSLNFRCASGVWNTHKEFDTREDHPYKYGYGMIFHGAYHYIEIISQLLDLNKLIFPDDKFTFTMCAFSASAIDQNDRIPKKYAEKLEDYLPDWKPKSKMGETDLTSTFCIRNETTNKVLTLGTISLEQTSPCVRTWKDLPVNDYNKNGRTFSMTCEAKLSTLYSLEVEWYDVPVPGAVIENPNEIKSCARTLERQNASILNRKTYTKVKNFKNVSHSDSNKLLLENWLHGTEDRSSLESHLRPMILASWLAKCVANQGVSMKFEF